MPFGCLCAGPWLRWCDVAALNCLFGAAGPELGQFDCFRPLQQQLLQDPISFKHLHTSEDQLQKIRAHARLWHGLEHPRLLLMHGNLLDENIYTLLLKAVWIYSS